MKLDNTYQLKRKSLSIVVNVVKFLFLAGMCYLFLFPIFYLIISAIQDPTVASRDPSIVWVPTKLTLDNFKQAIELLDYGKSFFLSFGVTVVCTILTLFSCSLVGYGFARFKFWERNIAFILVILLIIIPPQTTTISTFINFRFFDFGGLLKLFGLESVDLINSIPGLAMAFPALFASGIRAGLSIYIFRQFFLGQPKELEEAAKIDGCGALGTYFRVMIPLSSPPIITVSVLSAVWYWNDNFYSSLFFSDEFKPLATSLDVLRSTFASQAHGVSGYTMFDRKAIVAAAALLCVVPPMIFYLIVQRKFTESIERTGIVG